MIDELLALAERLAKASPKKPRQVDLRRSISTSYYAVFHAIARNAADYMVGTSRANRPNRAWVQTYRALDHRLAKNACNAVRNLGFPAGIVECADAFAELQEARHSADYDPEYRPTRADALEAVAKSRDAIAKLRGATINDRRAFAVQVLMKKR